MRKIEKRPDLEDAILKLARSSIEYFFKHGTYMPLPEGLPEELYNVKAGCFVTLYKWGELRGCIGTIEPVYPSLGEEIIHNAVSSAFRDPRFPPLRPEELDQVSISVDVLNPLEKVDDISQLDPKRYGVVVVSGYRRGVLLPDLEGVDTVDMQLSIALRKAGIRPDEPFEIYRFEVVRFGKKG